MEFPDPAGRADGKLIERDAGVVSAALPLSDDIISVGD
jgi:hypothetical protein